MKRKKSIFLCLMLIFVFTSTLFVGCNCKENSSSKNKLQTVRLNEVVRSTFYAPMYVAINKGFFKQEGLKIELSTGQGADAYIFQNTS